MSYYSISVERLITCLAVTKICKLILTSVALALPQPCPQILD